MKDELLLSFRNLQTLKAAFLYMFNVKVIQIKKTPIVTVGLFLSRHINLGGRSPASAKIGTNKGRIDDAASKNCNQIVAWQVC